METPARNDTVYEKENCFFCGLPIIVDDFGGVVRVNGEFKFFCNRQPCLMKFDERTRDTQSCYTPPIIYYKHQKNADKHT